MTKYTKGPWSVGYDGPSRPNDYLWGWNYVVYITKFEDGRWISYDKEDEDANFIAAAPELLEAAEALYINAVDRGETGDKDSSEYEDWRALREAIEKAKGEIV